MKYTTNYGFKKPEPLDTRNINDINDSFDLVDNTLKKVEDKNKHLETTFNSLTINAGNSNAEIVDARVDKNNKVYPKLGDRLDSVESSLAEKVNKISNAVNILDFGADRTGTNDCLQAFQNAIAYMQNNNINTLYIPTGKYKVIATDNSSINLPSDCTIIGDGANSIIKFDDNPSTARDSHSSLFRFDDTNHIEFRNLKIEGSLFDYFSSKETNANVFLWGTNVNELVIENVVFYGCRTLNTQISNCKNAKFIGNTVSHSLRDGFRCMNSSNVVATSNYFFNVSDDSIAVSTDDNVTGCEIGILISNNVFEFSQGIKCLGGKVVNITNNIFKRCTYTAIAISFLKLEDSQLEGHTPIHNINISNNLIADHLKRSYDGGSIITIRGADITADSLGNIPSLKVAPYNYNYLKGTSVNGIPATHGVIINNNQIIRTLPNVAKVSDWGYGKILDRSESTSWYDGQITDSSFSKSAIILSGCLYDVIISNNIMSGLSPGLSGMYVIWFYGNSRTFTGLSLYNVKVINNHFYDILGAVLYFQTGYPKGNIIVDGNTFDLDPFFKNPSHSADNTWNSAANGSAIGGDLKGVVIKNNAFADCYQAFSTVPTVAANNYAWAKTIDATANTNKGVALLKTVSITTIEIDADPTSPTFKQVI